MLSNRDIDMFSKQDWFWRQMRQYHSDMSNHNGVKIGIGGESLDNFAAQNVKICPSCDRINGAMKGIMSSVIRFLLCLCVSSLFSVP